MTFNYRKKNGQSCKEKLTSSPYGWAFLTIKQLNGTAKKQVIRIDPRGAVRVATLKQEGFIPKHWEAIKRF